ncbi:ABC transporter permease subunit [Streptomyces lonarensis]|uniref:ABC transporter permease subunit n=1 Tax=Streptomyces lonarensis TaxID=700599 RepID=A0A7X6CYD8_9ACTN|nr:ABC transporter permease subunit [Streptomyces lonarensis]NJQ04854.1 ABC transporter permease subunit [Streptomyces lonarensis]
MSATNEVLSHAGRRLRKSALIWGGVLALLVLTIVSTWPGFRDAETSFTDDLPESMLSAFGIADLSDPAGFLDSNLFSLVLPLLLICAAIAWTSNLTAGDEDSGQLEMELTLPVTRTQVYLGRFATVAAAMLGLGLVVLVFLYMCMPALELDASYGNVAAATFSVTLLGLLHAAVLYCAAGTGAARGAALGITAGVAGFGYVAQSLFPLSEALESLQVLSPWQWALGDGPAQHGFSLGGLVAILVVTGALVAVGTWGVNRRDIRGA